MMFDSLFQVITFVVMQTVILVTCSEYWFTCQGRHWKTSGSWICSLDDSECSYSLVSSNGAPVIIGSTVGISD